MGMQEQVFLMYGGWEGVGSLENIDYLCLMNMRSLEKDPGMLEIWKGMLIGLCVQSSVSKQLIGKGLKPNRNQYRKVSEVGTNDSAAKAITHTGKRSE